MTTESMENTEPSSPPQRMQCMEVWGGNRPVEKALTTAGLRVSLYCRVHGSAERGGDVYFLTSCASGRITRMLLADVSGHGLTVAGFATNLRDLMRKNVNVVKQAKLVEQINKQTSSLADQSRFATAVVCTFFAPTRSLQVSNARHPPPFLYRHEKRRWSPLAEADPESQAITNTPLGVLPDAQYPSLHTRLDHGDMLLCFSDGLTESCDRDGRILGIQGVLNILRGIDDPQVDSLISRLLQAVGSQNDENLTQDDLTVLLIEATPTKVGLAANVLAPYRLLRRVRDHTDLGATV